MADAENSRDANGDQGGAVQFAFRPPTRAIFSTADLSAFHDSQTYKDLIGFVRLLNAAAKGTTLTSPVEENETVAAIVAVLEEADKWVSDFPPLDQPMRFGNKAFRSWHQRLLDESEALMRRVLPERLHGAVPELAPYLGDAFGNQTRIDYGTGHETTFVFWLCCLFKLGLLPPPTLPAVVTRVFQRYLRLARRLQKTYMLEPAGSHGVWSLDDYQMLPFLFGSSQLIDHPEIRPRSIHDAGIMATYASDFMYLESVRFITEMKTGGTFPEYAPILNDVSALPTWSKLNSGMMKMYRGEVVGKFPVIQHFRFGSIMPCTWTPSREEGQGFGSVAPPRPGGAPPGVTGVAPWASGARGAPTGVAPWAKR